MSFFYRFIERHVKAVAAALWITLVVWFFAWVAVSKSCGPAEEAWVWIALSPLSITGWPTIIAIHKTNPSIRTYPGARAFIKEIFFFGIFPILALIMGIWNLVV